MQPVVMALGLGHGLSYPTWREQMTETTEIHRFKAGDDVPSWLVAFTPQSEDAVRGTITFERNTAVVKVDGNISGVIARHVRRPWEVPL